MSSLAHILLDYGAEVIGYDRGNSSQISLLESRGVVVFHKPEDLLNSDLRSKIQTTIHSSAIKTSPLLDWSIGQGIPILHRSKAMHEIFSEKISISVAGSHGKTSTTGMIAQILESTGSKPSIMIGGETELLGDRGGVWRQGQFGVYESDESDGTFLNHHANYKILTNVDDDHLDFYKTRERLLDAFLRYLNEESGSKNIIYMDDPGIQEILPRITNGKNTIVVTENRKIRECEFGKIYQLKIGTSESLLVSENFEYSFRIPFLGDHYRKNASLAIAMGLELNLPVDSILESIATYKGVKRRMEILYQDRGILILDDYGHHPTEVTAVLKAIQSAKDKGIVNRTLVIFQPHRFTRTKQFYQEFAESLLPVDEIFLLPIYSAGEDPIPGIESELIQEELKMKSKNSHLLNQSLEEDASWIYSQLKEGDLIVTLGAGNVRDWGKALVSILSQ